MAETVQEKGKVLKFVLVSERTTLFFEEQRWEAKILNHTKDRVVVGPCFGSSREQAEESALAHLRVNVVPLIEEGARRERIIDIPLDSEG